MSDRDRRLTEKGIRNLRKQYRVLEQSGFRADVVFASPYLRAKETADILAPAFGTDVESAELLVPGSSLDDVHQLLLGYGTLECVAVVGHQPDLGDMVHALTGAQVAMRKGTIAVIETEVLRPGRAFLVGLYDPDVMADLADKLC